MKITDTRRLPANSWRVSITLIAASVTIATSSAFAAEEHTNEEPQPTPPPCKPTGEAPPCHVWEGEPTCDWVSILQENEICCGGKALNISTFTESLRDQFSADYGLTVLVVMGFFGIHAQNSVSASGVRWERYHCCDGSPIYEEEGHDIDYSGNNEVSISAARLPFVGKLFHNAKARGRQLIEDDEDESEGSENACRFNLNVSGPEIRLSFNWEGKKRSIFENCKTEWIDGENVISAISVGSVRVRISLDCAPLGFYNLPVLVVDASGDIQDFSWRWESNHGTQEGRIVQGCFRAYEKWFDFPEIPIIAVGKCNQ